MLPSLTPSAICSVVLPAACSATASVAGSAVKRAGLSLSRYALICSSSALFLGRLSLLGSILRLGLFARRASALLIVFSSSALRAMSLSRCFSGVTAFAALGLADRLETPSIDAISCPPLVVRSTSSRLQVFMGSSAGVSLSSASAGVFTVACGLGTPRSSPIAAVVSGPPAAIAPSTPRTSSTLPVCFAVSTTCFSYCFSARKSRSWSLIACVFESASIKFKLVRIAVGSNLLVLVRTSRWN